ncbi:metal ABC transporter permease [Dactylosporangium sp. CS-033363]|uniref:metal ABC transporter permease n=1 Tax=Dactylosporangium sp. CS-033363 TaxID=3239935 RepID=UPI003D93CC59
MSIFAYDFMIRALLGALITGASAPAIGTYLVQRRLSLIGDGLGHVALTGVGLGLLLHQSPVIMAVLAAAAGAVVIELVRERGRTSGDIALSMLFYGGISGGVVLVNLSDEQSSRSLVTYLFGSPLTTNRQDLTVMLILGVAVLAVAILLRPWLFAVCHDEEYARVSGLPVRTLNLVLAVTTAVTVTVAMRAVGLLLVSALMVVPVATAQQITRGFRATMLAAIGLGLLVSGAGVWLSTAIDTGPGATVVLLAIAGFFFVTVGVSTVRAARRSRHRTPDPAPKVEAGVT